MALKRTQRHMLLAAVSGGIISVFALSRATRKRTPRSNYVSWLRFRPAGGPIDIVARMIMAKLSEAMAQSVIVDNRGGAGGTIGVDHVVKSPPDGYSMVLSSTSLGIDPHFFLKLPFDALRDLAPVSMVTTTPELMVVHPSLR